MARLPIGAIFSNVRPLSLTRRWVGIIIGNAPVAQLDRALDYESRGREFESSRARHFSQAHRDSRIRFYPLAVDWQEDEVVGGDFSVSVAKWLKWRRAVVLT